MDVTDVERRQVSHWDGVAEGISGESLQQPLAVLGFPDQRRMAVLAPPAGKARSRRRDAGLGKWAFRLALAGADVDAVDISPKIVEVAQRRADLAGVGHRVSARVMSAINLEFPDATFDVIHGQNIIHHPQPDSFGAEIARVHKPGGRAVFRENNGNHPVLSARDNLVGRFGIAKWSSDDGSIAKFAVGRAVADPGDYSWMSKQGSSLEDPFFQGAPV